MRPSSHEKSATRPNRRRRTGPRGVPAAMQTTERNGRGLARETISTRTKLKFQNGNEEGRTQTSRLRTQPQAKSERCLTRPFELNQQRKGLEPIEIRFFSQFLLRNKNIKPKRQTIEWPRREAGPEAQEPHKCPSRPGTGNEQGGRGKRLLPRPVEQNIDQQVVFYPFSPFFSNSK